MLIHCYQLKSIAPSDFLSFYLMFFFWSRSPSTLHLVVSLGYSWLWQFLRSSLFLLTLTVLRSANQVYDRVLLCWNLSDLFLWLDQIYKGFGEVDHRCKVSFSSHYIKCTCYQPGLLLLRLNLITWLEIVFVKSCHCKVTFPPLPFSCCTLWKIIGLCNFKNYC